MAMDLSRKCHHCGAPVGSLCNIECSANGDALKNLYQVIEDCEVTGGYRIIVQVVKVIGKEGE